MPDGNASVPQSQVNGSPTADGGSPASPETSKRRWSLRHKKAPVSSLRPITQEEIDSLPAALSSQQKAEKAAAEQASLAAASIKPKPWVEALHLLLGKESETVSPAEKPTIRDFSNRDFRGFALTGKDLSNANFTNANFRGVDLTRADLTGSDLRNANLQHSILEDAILTDVKNLTLRQVGGANLQNIQPPTAVTIDASAQVDEALKNAGKLYLTTISLCIFSVLVVLASTDIDIVVGTGKTKLPLVDLQIPTGWFFVITPLLITITHLTLHLHLLRAWESMLDLPAIYPDGRTVDRKVNPLLLNSIVLLHWPRLRGKLPPFTFTQAQLSKLTVYWAAPIALFLFWERYLVKQSTSIIDWHLALLFLTIMGGRVLRLLWFCSLRARSQRETLYLDWKAWPGHLVVLAIPLLLLSVCYITMFPQYYDPFPQYYHPYEDFRPLFSAHLDGLQIPTKPSDWIEQHPRGDPPNHNDSIVKNKAEQKRRKDWSDYLNHFKIITKTAQLNNASLQFAHMQESFLVMADLNYANLNYANLSFANLSRANLSRANLNNANLFGANLNYADLSYADLTAADLTAADLTAADLSGADLSGAHYSKKGKNTTKWPDGFDPISHGANPPD